MSETTTDTAAVAEAKVILDGICANPDAARVVICQLEKLRRELVRDRDELAARMPCDAGCVEYPEEECSRHGRTPADLWQRLYAVAKQRDALAFELDKDRHEFEPCHCRGGDPCGECIPCTRERSDSRHRTSRVVLAELAAEAGR